MSRFRFDLQKILELREEEEQSQARALADAERRAQEARRSLQELREVRDEEASKLMAAHVEGRPVGQLRNLGRVIEQLTQRVSEAESAYEEAAEAVKETRQELVVAMTQRRVMDQLKDRKQEAWRQATERAEQIRMDELALGIFQRQQERGDR